MIKEINSVLYYHADIKRQVHLFRNLALFLSFFLHLWNYCHSSHSASIIVILFLVLLLFYLWVYLGAFLTIIVRYLESRGMARYTWFNQSIIIKRWRKCG